MLQVIPSAGNKTAAAVGPQINADTATESGIKKGPKQMNCEKTNQTLIEFL